MNTYIAEWKGWGATFRASSLKEAKQLAQFHKRQNKYKGKTIVRLKKWLGSTILSIITASDCWKKRGRKPARLSIKHFTDLKNHYMPKAVNPIFNFWIENKIANHRKYYVSDIRQLFQKWLLIKGSEWVEYYNSEQVVGSFIADKNGLNATNEPKEFTNLVTLLKPDIRNYLDGINPKTKLPIH
jgi:hypothetical protein